MSSHHISDIIRWARPLRFVFPLTLTWAPTVQHGFWVLASHDELVVERDESGLGLAQRWG